MPDYSENKPIWPGSSSFTVGDTPFGFFDNDTLFQQQADSFAKHAAQNVGYPIMDVELLDINFYNAFESSVIEYSNQVNQVVAFPGEGTVLFGDKTQLTKPSAFDRINVRRLFILLEKAIANAARFQLFEFNDEFTRSQFVSIVEPFLRDIQGRGGITDFRVVCDASNNTAQVVDSNQFRGDIFIKPSRAINFIQLNFVAVRSGVEFSEVVGAV